MKSVSIWSYFYFGTCVRYLQDVQIGHKIKGRGFVLENIGSFFGTLDELSLKVTRRASFELQSFKEELEKVKDENALVSPEQASKLSAL